MQLLSPLDTALSHLDRALATMFSPAVASRTNPANELTEGELSSSEREQSVRLMRVNHVGEVCAQALYLAQAASTHNAQIKTTLIAAAQEETDHLAWCDERLQQLNGRVSVLNPLWYSGAFAFGLIAGKLGDGANLSFVVETERQVEAHLNSHLELLPTNDRRSRAIVSAMRDDEARHADHATALGGSRPSILVGSLMAAAANVMRTIAARI